MDRLHIELLAASAQDRACIAQTLADAAYQRAYQAGASMQDMRAGTRAVSAHSAVRQVRPDVAVLPVSVAGVNCEWLLPFSRGEAHEPPRPDQPLLVYLHGGGFVRGSLDLGRANAAELAAQAGHAVLAIGYRQAPEHPYPAAPDDVLRVFLALRDMGWSARTLVCVGESAGGTLALGLLPRLRALGVSAPAGVAALSPLADLSLQGASWVYNSPLDVADRATGEMMVKLYLAGQAADVPEASPVHHDYREACPLLLVAGRHETMLSDIEQLARVASRQVPVHLQVYEDMVHGFTRFAVPVADHALAAAAQWCLTRLQKEPAGSPPH